MAVYEALLKRGTKAEDIIVFGDSAGGSLAVEFALRLKAEKKPQTGVLLLASPWADLRTTPASRTTNRDRDLVLGPVNKFMYEAVLKPACAGSMDPADPRLSPVEADLSGLPPMLIQTGGYELFLTEDVALANRASADGVKVTLSAYPEMPHDFALCIPALAESQASLEEIRNFVKANMK